MLAAAVLNKPSISFFYFSFVSVSFQLYFNRADSFTRRLCGVQPSIEAQVSFIEPKEPTAAPPAEQTSVAERKSQLKRGLRTSLFEQFSFVGMLPTQPSEQDRRVPVRHEAEPATSAPAVEPETPLSLAQLSLIEQPRMYTRFSRLFMYFYLFIYLYTFAKHKMMSVIRPVELEVFFIYV